mmetsp:Transcript_282/g.298  ORF Transcript_282/g.298 Transcript_282/m.298 type:complete len:284 (-) Transcript_282:1324-2175(-)
MVVVGGDTALALSAVLGSERLVNVADRAVPQLHLQPIGKVAVVQLLLRVMSNARPSLVVSPLLGVDYGDDLVIFFVLVGEEGREWLGGEPFELLDVELGALFGALGAEGVGAGVAGEDLAGGVASEEEPVALKAVLPELREELPQLLIGVAVGLRQLQVLEGAALLGHVLVEGDLLELQRHIVIPRLLGHVPAVHAGVALLVVLLDRVQHPPVRWRPRSVEGLIQLLRLHLLRLEGRSLDLVVDRVQLWRLEGGLRGARVQVRRELHLQLPRHPVVQIRHISL